MSVPHHKQAIKRHLTRDIPGYATNGLVRRDFNCIYGLAFINPDDKDYAWGILKAFKLLYNHPHSSTLVIINYLENTWLYSTQYPIEMWSVFHAILLNDPRTNNISEGGNNAFNTAAGASHLSMPLYRKHLQLMNAEAETKFGQQSTHQNASRGPRLSTKLKDIRIKALVRSYTGNNMMEYLRSTGSLYQ